jgi:hypothetical protein
MNILGILRREPYKKQTTANSMAGKLPMFSSISRKSIALQANSILETV